MTTTTLSQCSDIELALLASVELDILKNDLKAAQAKVSIFHRFTENFCQSFEGFFGSDERFASTEHYTEYLEAAKYLQKLNYNDSRQSTIRRVEEEIDKMEQERLFGK